jgi:hypothetical protein
MSKIKWLLAIAGAAALVSAVSVQALAVPAGAVSARPTAASTGPDPATIVESDTMAAVTGPYVGATNPIRGVPGGGLPWMIKAATGSLKRDGHLRVRVRGLVLADLPSVPAAERGTNPVADFRAIVSCQSIGAGGTATITNVSTAEFPASTAGNSNIDATVSLPRPCIAPIVFVTSPTGSWFAATGG